jgi:pimeloyl-[acyl-carrier protein] methyl ester esterase
VFEQFATGLRSDWRRTLERFVALEAHGSEHAREEVRELRTHLFERGEPALAVLEQGLAALDRLDLRHVVAALEVPNLWIAGRRDRLVPATAMHWAATANGYGHYLELNSGHAPFLSFPKQIVDALADLANRIEPRAR